MAEQVDPPGADAVEVTLAVEVLEPHAACPRATGSSARTRGPSSACTDARRARDRASPSRCCRCSLAVVRAVFAGGYCGMLPWQDGREELPCASMSIPASWSESNRCCHRFSMNGPPASRPISSCCMGSACRRENSAGRGSRGCSPATCPRTRIPRSSNARALRVSAHLLIRRDGEPVQFVSFNDRAWHAGKSAWQGREACNDYSIGIECEGTDEMPYEAAQYQTLRTLLPMLLEAYPPFPAIASSGTATSRQAARPIRARRSTGARSAGHESRCTARCTRSRSRAACCSCSLRAGRCARRTATRTWSHSSFCRRSASRSSG